MTLNVTQARKKLYQLIKAVTETHTPVQITGKNGNAVLVSEEDWNAVQETLYLLSVPGMRQSIRDGMDTPVEACSEDPGW